MKNKVWESEFNNYGPIDLSKVVSVRGRKTTVTGGCGPVDPFSASIFEMDMVDVLTTDNTTITIWGDEGKSFLKFYKNNK